MRYQQYQEDNFIFENEGAYHFLFAPSSYVVAY